MTDFLPRCERYAALVREDARLRGLVAEARARAAAADELADLEDLLEDNRAQRRLLMCRILDDATVAETHDAVVPREPRRAERPAPHLFTRFARLVGQVRAAGTG